MIKISHRGNLFGPDPSRENSPEYIKEALDAGYDVEVDVWIKDWDLYLGHDYPQYRIDISFLVNKHLWCHAKNIDAFELMIRYDIHCFWHENDDYALTSLNYIWCFPGKFVSSSISIRVLPELGNERVLGNEYAICSDYIKNY